MPEKSDLQHLESECETVDDLINLALQALEDPADEDYAVELVGEAIMDNQSLEDFVYLAQLATMHLSNSDCFEKLLVQVVDACMDSFADVPNFHIEMAELAACYLPDSDYAEKLLVQAEDFCTEPMEYIEVANAWTVLLGNLDRGLALICEAADELNLEDIHLLADFADRVGEQLLRNILIYQGAGYPIEHYLYMELAQELMSSSKVKAAKRVTKSAEHRLETVEDSIAHAKLIIQLFDDKSKAREILKSAEWDCEFTKDYIALAKGCAEVLDEPERIDDILEEAARFAGGGEEIANLAYTWLEFKNYRRAAFVLLRQAVPNIYDRKVLQKIAVTATTELNDHELALQCYQRTADIITHPGDLIKFAVESWETLGCEGYPYWRGNSHWYIWDIFHTVKAKITNANDWVALAEAVIQTLNDRDMVYAIYRDAATACDSFSELEQILASQRAAFDDRELTRETLNRMTLLATESAELVAVFNAARSSSQDSEMCRNVLVDAEYAATCPADLESVIAAVCDFAPDDRAWISNLKNKLEHRQANQTKYTEIQALQKVANSALDLMRLAKCVISEVEDPPYARKLIDEALAGLDEKNTEIDFWLMAIEIAASDLCDADLVRKIALKALDANQNFSSAYMLARKLGEVIEEPQQTGLIRQILGDWHSQISDPFVSIKLIKIVLEVVGDIEWSEQLLDSLDSADFGLLQLVELGDLYQLVGSASKAQALYRLAINTCESVSDLSYLMNCLQTSGIGEIGRKSIYRESRERFSGMLDQLRWIEGISLHFEDREWAEAAYNAFETKISNDVLHNVFKASRQQHLGKKFY